MSSSRADQLLVHHLSRTSTHTFWPLTFTAPCTTNCRACRALLANKALNIAVSSLLSSGANVICMYGIAAGLAGGLSFSSPDPRPADSIDPLFLARYSGFMGTTDRSFRENIRSHWPSLTCSPWYERSTDLALHFCWKKVLVLYGGAITRERL